MTIIKLLIYFYEQTRVMAILLLFALIPFLMLLYYTAMNVEVELLRRQVNNLNRRHDSLVKRNAALKKAVNEFAGSENASFQVPNENEIVRIRLGESGRDR